MISGVSRKKSKEIIDEIVTRRSRWVYFCPGSTQEMAVQRSGRGIVDDHAGGVGRTGQRHRHNAMGVFLCLTKIIDIIRVSARLMHMAQCGGAVNRIAIVAMRS